ncbi:ABC transporter ATP-binding protein [Alicyclobacillus fastidiosus]|uniref:ABC transporter ATP-binding protein n=1 Tax=Alicyclobacillus fastidiosus TaxID=392011 RepID=A0ABY6ZI01_9BACL|nr:ABC transporter ATP-binding protein [Alicyclobacillus fastidiosus]WAH42477.1 ABC transporter ATP-binding protein [Alicyclobacillus fastidiosus]GMA64311.1 putative ABC transporter ATP-binding protein YhcH [Alicyclobacillus fastidiosus]
MHQDVAVQIRDLTKMIGNKPIVDGLSFDIPKGEVFGLLGPNGAGKTTTIRMIVGLISISRGDVLINGLDVKKNFKAAMQHVGAIVENPEMYKFLTGYQNLKHFAKMSKGVTRERIHEVVKQVGLEERINDKVKTYSLGMRQRLGLAQALLRKPDVIILDEPTNGLDPAGIRELRDYLRELASQEGIAVIVSSHLLSEMELMCDRVAIIQAGKLIDVRAIRDRAVDAAEAQTFAIEVDNGLYAAEVLSTAFPKLTLKRVDNSIEIRVIRERVPDVVHALDANGIRIYGVQALNKSLEETFLEITGGASNV